MRLRVRPNGAVRGASEYMRPSPILPLLAVIASHRRPALRGVRSVCWNAHPQTRSGQRRQSRPPCFSGVQGSRPARRHLGDFTTCGTLVPRSSVRDSVPMAERACNPSATGLSPPTNGVLVPFPASTQEAISADRWAASRSPCLPGPPQKGMAVSTSSRSEARFADHQQLLVLCPLSRWCPNAYKGG
jgi:hypothetical protein